MIILLTVVQKKLTINLYKYNAYTAIGIFMNADPIVIDNMDPDVNGLLLTFNNCPILALTYFQKRSTNARDNFII